MSQFGFGQQIGQQRDALSGSSRSNYASEEADLTDGLIKQVESIDIPNTNQFYENIKFVEKVKEQGNFLNTMKQLASTFEAGARFKTAFDAMQARKDATGRFTSKDRGKTLGSGTSSETLSQAATIENAEVETETKQINDASVELENEKNETTSTQFKSDITDLQFNLYEVQEGLNQRQIANEINGSLPAMFSTIASQSGLDKITTTGEAREFVGVNGTTGKILEGIFYEYAERGFDITNKRVQNRILARHAETILKAEQAAFNTWSTNHRQKVRLAQEETLKTGLINESDYKKIVDPKKMIYPE